MNRQPGKLVPPPRPEIKAPPKNNSSCPPQSEKECVTPQQKGPEPYPTVCIKEKNPRYVQILKMDFASSKSELTTTAQYLNQGWVFARSDPEFAKTVHGFAMDEMHHLNLLGEMITALGGNPSFAVMQRNRVMVWNAGMVSYAQSPKQAARENAMGERLAIDHYKQQCTVIRDEGILLVLHRIVRDEERHLAYFEKYMHNGG